VVGPVVEVTDPDDERLADYHALTDVALRTSYEPPHGLFIAEGSLVVGRAVAAGYRLRSVLLSRDWLGRTTDALAGTDAPVYVGTDDLLREITGYHVHRGALASVHRKPLPDVGSVVAASRRLLVFEDAVSHTNLGAVFRSAAGLGLDGVLLSPSCADPLYRRSVRVSMGAVFTLPYARAADWPAPLHRLRDAGWDVLALTPADDATDLADYRGRHRGRRPVPGGHRGEHAPGADPDDARRRLAERRFRRSHRVLGSGKESRVGPRHDHDRHSCR
jgi:tRNA G18 (ribose-2'-O)-methylase SpoU